MLVRVCINTAVQTCSILMITWKFRCGLAIERMCLVDIYPKTSLDNRTNQMYSENRLQILLMLSSQLQMLMCSSFLGELLVFLIYQLLLLPHKPYVNKTHKISYIVVVEKFENIHALILHVCKTILNRCKHIHVFSSWPSRYALMVAHSYFTIEFCNCRTWMPVRILTSTQNMRMHTCASTRTSQLLSDTRKTSRIVAKHLCCMFR